MRDIKSLNSLLSVWKGVINKPYLNWIDQCRGPGTQININDLVLLSKAYPVVFQNFICDLKMQPSHPYVMIWDFRALHIYAYIAAIILIMSPKIIY